VFECAVANRASRVATEVEKKENKVLFGAQGSFGAKLVILDHLLGCGLNFNHPVRQPAYTPP
jgi:hypothetical protein